MASAARLRATAVALFGAAGLAACATPHPRFEPGVADSGLKGTERPYQVGGVWYYPKADPHYDEKGTASWYGEAFHNRLTADGEVFDMTVASAAHKTLPLPSYVEVTNLENGRKLKVRLNDRGPFVGDRLIDMSQAAAEQLGFRAQGLTKVRVRYLGPAPALEPAQRTQVARAEPPPVAPRAASGQGTFRVQAAAFSSRERADAAANRLASAGPVSVEPMRRGFDVLYRVVLGPADDEGSASDLRRRCADLGFPDAQVIRPS